MSLVILWVEDMAPFDDVDYVWCPAHNANVWGHATLIEDG